MKVDKNQIKKKKKTFFALSKILNISEIKVAEFDFLPDSYLSPLIVMAG